MWWRSKDVEELIFQHFSLVEQTLEASSEAIRQHLDGDDAGADRLAQKAGRLEGEADDVRRHVESLLLKGALLPESLQDLWDFIEQVDKLADRGEALLDFVLLQRVEIPADLQPYVDEISGLTDQLIDELRDALKLLFENLTKVPDHTRRVEELEHEIDGLEREAVRRAFGLEVELAHKTQIRELFMILTDISDQGEDVSDLLELAVARRRL
ncbi:MAG: DUF47 domain-containing protein [Candidatus Bipolaricaulia bacterium]